MKSYQKILEKVYSFFFTILYFVSDFILVSDNKHLLLYLPFVLYRKTLSRNVRRSSQIVIKNEHENFEHEIFRVHTVTLLSTFGEPAVCQIVKHIYVLYVTLEDSSNRKIIRLMFVTLTFTL